MRKITLAVVALAAMGTTAKADVTLSGTLFGGPQQNNATCYLFNAGNFPVSVRSAQIFSANGAAAFLDFNFCNNPVNPGASCVIQAGPAHAIANNSNYSCKFVVRGNPAVSGEFEIRRTGNQNDINTFVVIGRVPLTVRSGGSSF